MGCISQSTKKVYCYAETPAEIDTLVFGNWPDAILYVPEASLESYKNAVGWQHFYRERYIEKRAFKGFSPCDSWVAGVSADGVAQMRISYAPFDREYSINEPDLSQAKLRFEIDGEESTDEELIGKTGDMEWDGFDWGLLYTAPDGFPQREGQKYYLDISLLDQYDGLVGYMGCNTIKVVRPGVILVHGFNSNGKCFGSLENHLVYSGDYEDWQILRADYSSSHWASFDRNTSKYGVINESAADLFSQMEENNILSASYDIVGHSMGES